MGYRRAEVVVRAIGVLDETGLEALSMRRLAADLGVQPGALYHHFDNKAALGYAVVDEVIRPYMRTHWEPLKAAEDPITCAISGLRKRREKFKERLLSYGCPFNNLVQEMSPVDEGFRTRLQGILDEWSTALATALEHGKSLHTVRADLNTQAAAIFIVSAFEGLVGMAKAAQSVSLYEQGLRGLIDYLEHLRPASAT